MKKILSFVLVFAVMMVPVFVLTGCTYERLYSDRMVKAEVQSHFPDVEFVKSEKKELEGYEHFDEYVESKLYTFKNNDFEFHVYENISRGMWGLEKDITTDYYEKLYELKKIEIDEMFGNGDIPIVFTSNETIEKIDMFEEENPYCCLFGHTTINSSISSFHIYFHITEEKQIPECVDMLENLYSVVEEYLPNNKNEMVNDYFSVVFWTSNEYLPEGAHHEDYWSSFYSYGGAHLSKNINFDTIRNQAVKAHRALY